MNSLKLLRVERCCDKSNEYDTDDYIGLPEEDDSVLLPAGLQNVTVLRFQEYRPA